MNSALNLASIQPGFEGIYRENVSLIEQMRAMGIEPIGIVIVPTKNEIEQTFKSIMLMIEEKKKWIKEKSDFNSTITEKNKCNENLQTQIENLEREIIKLNNELIKQKNNNQMLIQKKDEDIKKMKEEKAESTTYQKQLLTKVNECTHEIRKKDADLSNIKIQLNKQLSNKDPSKSISSITISKYITPKVPITTQDSEFAMVVCESIGQRIMEFQKENTLLKGGLNQINEIIAEIYEARRKSIIKLDPTFDNQFENAAKIPLDLLDGYFAKTKERVTQIVSKNANLLKTLSNKIDDKLAKMSSFSLANQAEQSEQKQEIPQTIVNSIAQLTELTAFYKSMQEKKIEEVKEISNQPIKNTMMFMLSDEEIKDCTDKLLKSESQLLKLKEDATKSIKEGEEVKEAFKKDADKINQFQETFTKLHNDSWKFLSSIEIEKDMNKRRNKILT